MTDGERLRSGRQWTPSRVVRVGVGLLAGFGAVGLAGGITLIARRLDLGILDLGAIVVLAAATAFAGAVLRERDAVVAITAGALLGSLGAIVVLHGPWVLVGLTALTAWVLVTAAVSSLVGAWLGRESTRRDDSRRQMLMLVIVGVIGAVAWIGAASLA